MTEDVDPFDYLGDAEPLTFDEEDSVANRVETDESEQLRASAGIVGADLSADDNRDAELVG